MACGGYGVEHYLAIFENIGLQYKPDLVILAIYVDNDVTDRLVIGAEEAKSERSFKNDFLYPINIGWKRDRMRLSLLESVWIIHYGKLDCVPIIFPRSFGKIFHSIEKMIGKEHSMFLKQWNGFVIRKKFRSWHS